MDLIISIILSAVGSYFGDIDFFTLHSITSTALMLYKSWLEYINKTYY